MTHTYKISGMTCGNCRSTVQGLLSGVPGVKKVDIDLQKGQASIEMDTHVETAELKNALRGHPKYQLTGENTYMPPATDNEEDKRSWLEKFKPILLIYAYLTAITVLYEVISGDFEWMRLMSHFMAGFFLIFSFFKFLDLNGFADSYSTYDIIAKRWRGWGYVYAFLELGIGLAYLFNFYSLLTNASTFIIMTISIIGVLQSVLNKKKIRCACLGTVFNLPMTTVTIIEDAHMIIMSGIMLIILL